MIQLVKKFKLIIIFFAVIGIVIVIYVYFIRPKGIKPDFLVVKRMDIVQEVDATGRVKPAQSVDLAFEKSGKISRVYASVGDKVKENQLLINLENSDLMAQLSQSEAALESAQAKLDELKKGARPEEIQVKEAELKKAQQDLDNYYNSVADILNDAHNKADDALRKQIDELFSDDFSDNPQLTFLVSDSYAEIDSESQKISANNALKELKLKINNLPSDHLSLDQELIDAKKHLITIKNFLIRLTDAVSAAIGISSTTAATYKGYINTARTNVNTALANITAQEGYVAAQRATIERIQNELTLKKAGTIEEQIRAQEAQIKQAQANIQNVQAQIQKTIIRSPINGIVTKQEAKKGEIAPANTSIISVISEFQFEIEANIAEVDIAKVKIGDPVNVTLDAYGDDLIFKAKVTTIDPAETIIEGVATYKTTFQFLNEDERINPGMTANLDIITERKENVIVIPQRAVIVKNGEKFVQILQDGGKVEKIKIETGVRGSDGNVEIIKGVDEGDKVIIYIKEQ